MAENGWLMLINMDSNSDYCYRFLMNIYDNSLCLLLMIDNDDC